MSKKIQLAVAAALAMGASAAQAGITIPAGDWTVDIGGNVNAYYTHTKRSGNAAGVPVADAAKRNNDIQTGLLPSALGIGGKTRQNDLDIAFQFTFFTGVDAGQAVQKSGGANTLNIRQAYLTFGDKSWGTIKAGRDLGIFGSDAILSDMTLLGVGVGAGAGGTSTLGRIGSGYMYADWVGQISYQSPNWNGFSFAAGVREPWTNGTDTSNRDMGFEGKVNYEWAGDFAGKVWLSGITEKYRAVGAFPGYTARGWDIGGKVSYAGAELVGYYYDGEGISGAQNGILNGLMFAGSNTVFGKSQDDQGGYVQATYKLPNVGTKLGLSWGESNSTPAVAAGAVSNEWTNKSWVVGAYHPLTKSLNLVAEYTDQKLEDSTAGAGATNLKNKTYSLGAILFF